MHPPGQKEPKYRTISKYGNGPIKISLFTITFLAIAVVTNSSIVRHFSEVNPCFFFPLQALDAAAKAVRAAFDAAEKKLREAREAVVKAKEDCKRKMSLKCDNCKNLKCKEAKEACEDHLDEAGKFISKNVISPVNL